MWHVVLRMKDVGRFLRMLSYICFLPFEYIMLFQNLKFIHLTYIHLIFYVMISFFHLLMVEILKGKGG